MPPTAPTVIVTGAAGGIGLALVQEFASRGARVVAVDLPSARPEQAIAGLGDHHRAYGCDLGSEVEILALFEALDRDVGRVDVLMNNAAIGPIMSDTRTTDFAHFQLTVRVNTIGPFIMAREAAARMEPGSAIVNTASLAGVLANPRRNAYAASKAALISLTKSLACEWASRGIRVNAVAPGYVRTPMVAELERTGKADIGLVRRRVPMGRMGRPDEIASVAAFLASPEARYITGAVLAVDGGWMSFNQPGHAHPQVDGVPADEVERPRGHTSSRVVVVVGGARGIGKAIAQRFAAGGDRVAVADKDGSAAAAVVTGLGTQHMAVTVDISDEAQVREAFQTIGERMSGIDVLVNDAAIADVFKPGLDQSGADLAATLDVNLAGTFLCTREALGLMEGRRGMILNLGSINTFLPFAPRHGYGASKAAVDVFTRCLAGELGPQGHRTATIAPGYVRTPGVAELELSGRIDTDKIRRRIPMGDMGRPEDIAEAAWFLASPAASYVNGGILYVDGGWTSFGNAGDAASPQD